MDLSDLHCESGRRRKNSTLTYYRQFETGGRPDTLVITDFRFAGKKVVRVPAGDFETLEFEGVAKSQSTSTTLYPESYYASEIGLVLKICPFAHGNGHRFEQRLLEYKVQP